jgi:hypothetical protein
VAFVAVIFAPVIQGLGRVSRRCPVNHFFASRLTLSALVVFVVLVCVQHAQATDINGTISSTVTIFDDSRLVGDVVRRNIIVGNPAAQVIKTFVLANQQGADIAFQSSFTGANNTLEDNFCLTYIQGAGPATAPCPNIRTKGVEEAASRLTTPMNGEKRSNGAKTMLGVQLVSPMSLLLVLSPL